ncbi:MULTISPECIES: MFS transporter [unclassified Variovorax]|uniref:MFS transporter n=1 Tax=unclassified Variovorax TaxID=663243 RepID=UPI0008D34B3A|nr:MULTISPECIES: MFS transporter [unclassified Variovorax]SEJ59002.1 Major Facilitator Superfamily protein [Variovorax sp. OK202]SFC64366.1 Major Facilitator Superfamily protein [Variovorax sp. OK212]
MSSTSSKNWLLAAVCLAALGMPLSFTGPAVVLPAIHGALGGSPVQLNWVTNAFMLSFGATLMAAGALADAYGRKRVFLQGLAVVALSSALLTLAPGIVAFDLARALQGLGSAAAFAAGTAALAQVFDGTARTRAFSLIGTSFGVGLSCGAILSGWLAETFGWQAVMLSPGAVSLAALCIAAPVMRESRNPQAMGLDLPGTVSFTAALSLLTLGVLQAPDSGWGSPWVVGALAGAVLMGAAFIAIERRVAHPMLDLSLLRIPRFVGVQLLAAAPAYGFVVLLVLLPIRFIGLEGRSALEAGSFMFALSGPILIVPTLAASLAHRFSAGVISAAGLLVCAAGLCWLGRCAPGAPLHELAGALLLIGAGIGLPWGLMDGLAVSVVPRERAGMASGIFNTVRVAGEGIALALVGAGLTALVAARLGPSASASQAAQRVTTGDLSQALALLPGVDRAALLQAYGAAFGTLLCVLAGVTVLTALVVFVFLRGEAPAHEPEPEEAAVALESPAR